MCDFGVAHGMHGNDKLSLPGGKPARSVRSPCTEPRVPNLQRGCPMPARATTEGGASLHLAANIADHLAMDSQAVTMLSADGRSAGLNRRADRRTDKLRPDQ